jgi:transcriptional regulator with XRE-family HTH domain
MIDWLNFGKPVMMFNKGMNRNQISKHSGISRQVVYSLFNGETVPSWGTISKLAALWGVTPEEMQIELAQTLPQVRKAYGQLGAVLDRVNEIIRKEMPK